MPVGAENARQQLLPEPVHDRHDDNERRNAQHDAQQRKPGDHGNESLLPPGTQIAKGDQALECRKHQPASLAKADSSDTTSRSPARRYFNSKTPVSRPFGPVTSRSEKRRVGET